MRSGVEFYAIIVFFNFQRNCVETQLIREETNSKIKRFPQFSTILEGEMIVLTFSEIVKKYDIIFWLN